MGFYVWFSLNIRTNITNTQSHIESAQIISKIHKNYIKIQKYGLCLKSPVICLKVMQD